MNKKTYKKPTMKVIELEDNAILAGSNEPQTLNIYNEEVNDAQRPSTVSEKQWGTPW